MSTNRAHIKTGGLAWLTLFASSGTLICCALPIVLVSLGMGATVAALTGSFPLLITLSQHKAWVFGFSGLLLGLTGWWLYRRDDSCPGDARLGALCARSRVWNRRIFLSSALIWLTGFFAAYLALPLRIRLGW